MADIQENVIEWITGDAYISVTVTQERYRNWLRKMHDDKPERFKDFRDDNNGYVWAVIPATWLRLAIPKSETLSEEQLEALRERARNLRPN